MENPLWPLLFTILFFRWPTMQFYVQDTSPSYTSHSATLHYNHLDTGKPFPAALTSTDTHLKTGNHFSSLFRINNYYLAFSFSSLHIHLASICICCEASSPPTHSQAKHLQRSCIPSHQSSPCHLITSTWEHRSHHQTWQLPLAATITDCSTG